MRKEELSFEELPDGSKIITIQGINQFGEKYIRQERIKCPSVWDALKRLTYTADDMEAFFSWATNNGWSYGELTELWYNDDEELEALKIEEVLKLWEEQK